VSALAENSPPAQIVRRHRQNGWTVPAGWLFIAFIALLTLSPILVVIYGAIAGNAWADTLGNTQNWSALFYSIILALRAPFAAFFGFLLAWCLIRFRLPGGRTIEFCLWVTFFIPILPMTLSWILLLSPNHGLLNDLLLKMPFVHAAPFNIYSVGGILWVHVISSSIPIMVVLLSPAIRQLDASFEDASRICGSSSAQAFFSVTLPILAPAIATAALASFIKSLEAFEVEQLIGRPGEIYVYSTRIYDLVSWEPPRFESAMALSSIALVFLLLVAVAYKSFARIKTYSTVLGRGSGARKIDVGTARWFISAALFLVVAVALVFPAIMLVLGSFMKLFGFFNIPSPFDTVHWRNVLEDPIFFTSLRNSLIVSLFSGIGGVLFYSMIAYFIVRSKHPGRHIVELLAWLPWSIPGILLGISMLWLILSTPFVSALYGSLTSLVIILIISQMPAYT
jgi:iron(III) transport system permease protein